MLFADLINYNDRTVQDHLEEYPDAREFLGGLDHLGLITKTRGWHSDSIINLTDEARDQVKRALLQPVAFLGDALAPIESPTIDYDMFYAEVPYVEFQHAIPAVAFDTLSDRNTYSSWMAHPDSILWVGTKGVGVAFDSFDPKSEKGIRADRLQLSAPVKVTPTATELVTAVRRVPRQRATFRLIPSAPTSLADARATESWWPVLDV